MEPVVGIICEYDPFHNGHARQFETIRRILPDARILCLMSGCFTQRGMPSIHLPSARAEMALKAGAELVLELPCLFAVRDAEHFAMGGVQILNELGFVTHICFGTEDEPALIEQAAALLEKPTEAFSRRLKESLHKGLSFAAAQGQALEKVLGSEAGKAFEKPNNILGLCYLRALKRTGSSMMPLIVKRDGDYHDDTLHDQKAPSASAVRKAFWEGRLSEADAACPFPLPHDPICRPDAADRLLLYKLRSLSAESIARIPDCSEGLENRIKASAGAASSREDLLCRLKTRRYTYTRLNRICCHTLLDVTSDLAETHPRPEYVRILGIRKNTGLTFRFSSSRIPVIAKAADGPLTNEAYALDLRAYDLWALCAGLPQGLMLRQSIFTL